MRRMATAALTLLVILLGSVAGGSAQAATSHLDEIQVAGNPVVTVTDGVPRVGDARAIRRYHDAGRFDGDRAAVARAARARLLEFISATCPDGPQQCTDLRAAIVVDLDDTLLDWYPSYARTGFRLPGKVRQAGVRACVTPVIAPVRSLVNDAIRAGVAVLFVSGRREPVRPVTESCVKKRGVASWDALILRSDAQDHLSAGTYKQQAFDQLEADGWNVVISIGDQRGDLIGDPATSRFLLPNPLYRTL